MIERIKCLGDDRRLQRISPQVLGEPFRQQASNRRRSITHRLQEPLKIAGEGRNRNLPLIHTEPPSHATSEPTVTPVKLTHNEPT
jgi:hypothetical protein